MEAEEISENIWFLPGTNAIVRTTDTNEGPVCEDIGRLQKVSVSVPGAQSNEKATIKAWGRNNRQPFEREELIKDNNIVGELLGTKRDIILGSGLQPYRLRHEAGKKIIDLIDTPPEIEDFHAQVGIDDYLLNAANNLVKHSGIFTEFIRGSGDNDKIASMKVQECRHIRCEEQDEEGKVNNFYWCGNWGGSIKDNKQRWPVKKIPAYAGEAAAQKKFMTYVGDSMLTDEYYFMPSWWGGKNWVSLANIIPVYHISNLGHGYNIRYHVEIPKDYFSDNSTAAQTQDGREKAKKAKDQARKEFIDNLNKFLMGVTNVGRTVVTEYEINRAAAKDFPGIKIKPIESNLQDEALLKLFEKSNEANISGQGIHPTLAAIQTQGKLSSGSEIRNALIMYTAIKTPTPRKLLLKAIDLMHRINGFDKSIRWMFRDIEITKLDDEPKGQQEVAIV